ncbi:MAG: aminoacyl--tRNA ligase-related protein [Patescibacteria group bacterium]|jgi:prolyl-tRNA synthetase
MKYSQLFTKTVRNAPADAETINARLLTQAGFVDQLMAGVYSYLPMGLRVLRKIENIAREEMDAIGGQEVLMPMLHPKANWEVTGGWDNIDVLFKIASRTEKEYALGQSEEEIVTPLVLSRATSYKDFPVAVYQIHWKFRDELRAKSGLMRGREFFMKDMYSFHRDQADFDKFYERAKEAYLKIYSRLGLTAKVTEASGGAFSTKISYEFMVLTDAGEDDILYCDVCEFCVNTEIAKVKAGDTCPKCSKGTLAQARASEVGNVFDLGDKYGKDFKLAYKDENDQEQYPIMGCYGIGISRVMGVIVEKFNDERGILWPKSVAPFGIHLVALSAKTEEATAKIWETANELYASIQSAGMEVLFDDRKDMRAGEKFADADLIGVPVRLVISEKSLAAGGVEWKDRASSEASIVPLGEILPKL